MQDDRFLLESGAGVFVPEAKDMFGLGIKRLAQFARQLATLLDAGVPMVRALASLERHGVSRSTRPVITRLRADIEAGCGFTQAVERQGRTFPPLVTNLIRAGEQSGNLEAVLRQIADHYDLQREIRKRLLLQLAYPAALVFAAICTMSILAYVSVLLEVKLSESVRAPARSPMATALRTFGTGMGIVAAILTLYFVLTRALSERRLVQEVLLHIPLLGAVRRHLALARFSWAMELMLRAGTSIREALQRSLESTSNGAYMARRSQVDHSIIGGATVCETLSGTRLFPDDYMEATSIAEESGSMDESFGRLARNHFDRAETAMRISASVVAWTIWFCVAALVAYVVISFYTGYFRMVFSQGLGK